VHRKALLIQKTHTLLLLLLGLVTATSTTTFEQSQLLHLREKENHRLEKETEETSPVSLLGLPVMMGSLTTQDQTPVGRATEQDIINRNAPAPSRAQAREEKALAVEKDDLQATRSFDRDAKPAKGGKSGNRLGSRNIPNERNSRSKHSNTRNVLHIQVEKEDAVPKSDDMAPEILTIDGFEIPKKVAKRGWMEKSPPAHVAKSNLWDPLRENDETVLVITAQKGGYKIDVENCNFGKSPVVDGLVDITSLPIYSKDSYFTADMKAARKEVKKMKNWLLKNLNRCGGFFQLIEITDSLTQWIGEMAQDGKLPYTTPDLFKSHMVMWENLLRARFELYSLLMSKASVECFLPEEISRIARAHMNLTNVLLPFTYWLAMEQCEEEHPDGVYSGKPTFACNRNGVANASVHDLVATRFTIDYSLIFANQGSTLDDMTEILPFMAAFEAASTALQGSLRESPSKRFLLGDSSSKRGSSCLRSIFPVRPV
jgi:hypothetical protein